MNEGQSHLAVQQEGGVTRVEFLDRQILEEANIQNIGAHLGRIIEQHEKPKLLLSFKNVEHLSSAALGALITVQKKVQEKGGQLRLADIDRPIYEVFAITKLNSLFQIHDDSEAAVKSFE